MNAASDFFIESMTLGSVSAVCVAVGAGRLVFETNCASAWREVLASTLSEIGEVEIKVVDSCSSTTFRNRESIESNCDISQSPNADLYHSLVHLASFTSIDHLSKWASIYKTVFFFRPTLVITEQGAG